MTSIRWRWRWYGGYTAVARNGLRRTRILSRLRYIRRQHPALKFEFKRGEFFITVHFDKEQDLLLFALLWPTDGPKWEQINDISGSTKETTVLD